MTRPASQIDQGTRWLDAMYRGDWATAWAVQDAVLSGRDPATRDDPARPYHERWVWNGRPLGSVGRGQVLVRCYHGLGDTLQFWRYLPILQAQADVTVEVQPELLPLLATTARCVPFDPAHPAPPQHDVEIMELFHALRLPPPPAPYLMADPFPLAGFGPTVGVCWVAGGWDSGRSVPWPLLSPLAERATVVSLARGPDAAGAPWIDPLAGSMDIMQTARLLAALDHIVTVDTMVAHLAGALGRPTSLLLRADADWRWMRGRNDSPWYPQTRLYRQPSPGEWDPAVARAIHDVSVGTYSIHRAL